MSRLSIPKGYKSSLGILETERAIKLIKTVFEANLCTALNLERISAPLFVDPTTGLNDNLNGVERPVRFEMADVEGKAEIVHSLAKWKRMALYKYGFGEGSGLYTDMNAIRRDEELSNLHSIYVDQWDWEKVISLATRNTEYLKSTVRAIVGAISDTLTVVRAAYPAIITSINPDVFFITTQELEDMYPGMSVKERENAICKEKKTVFIQQIGDVLKGGEKHDGRAPDYDDWKLNGDILFWNDLLGIAFEISSMGIRVDSKSLSEQLTKADCDDRRKLEFHRMLLADQLPLTMGGGIGQSRLCMLLLGKAHIGEVQVSIWDKSTLLACKDAGINIL